MNGLPAPLGECHSEARRKGRKRKAMPKGRDWSQVKWETFEEALRDTGEELRDAEEAVNKLAAGDRRPRGV
jgi:hypothetical protein